MNIKNLKIAIVIILIALPTFAVKVYQNLNMTDQNITNVPTPIADNHAVNNEYIEKLVDELYEGTNLSVAVPAKCTGGQIPGYTPVPGEDLYNNMQWGVDWETNTRFTVDSTGSNVYDNLTGLMWTKNADIKSTNGADAITYCNTLVYGGYSDWRLPNVNELLSLIDLSQRPAVPDGHPFSDVLPVPYWSITPDASDSGKAWLVDFRYGRTASSVKTMGSPVLPVRSGL